MKSVLVLGATGFVGTHVSLALANENIELILGCKNRDGLHPKIKTQIVREGDLYEQKYLDKLFLGIDIVINAFAWTSMFGHQKESKNLFYLPSIQIIESAKIAGVKRFINLSSVSVTDTKHKYDPNRKGKETFFWPHLDNVIVIENHLRQSASESFQVINLRCGHFIGEHYGIGLLPILLPRLKTHLVPWIEEGRGRLPLIADADIAQAFVKAALSSANMETFESFDILGPETPTLRDLLEFIHREYGYALPHFNVSDTLAHYFGLSMELLDPIFPFEPLVTRSIVHLLKDSGTDNKKAREILGYSPAMDWKEAVRRQINEIRKDGGKKISMVKEHE